MGRNTLLTEELLERFQTVVAGAMTVQDACLELGIHRDTFWTWCKRGEADIDNADPNTLHARFADAAITIPTSRRRKITSALIRGALSGDPRHIKLYYNFVERMGDPSKVEHSGPDGLPMTGSVDLSKLDKKDARELVKLLKKANAKPDGDPDA